MTRLWSEKTWASRRWAEGKEADPYFPNVTLLIQPTGATAGDLSPLASSTDLLNGATISDEAPVSGIKSIYLDGSNDHLRVNSSTPLNFSTRDYTVECWMKPESKTGSKILIGGQSNFAFRLGAGYGGNLNGLQITKAGEADYDNCSFTFIAGTWYHVAVTRQSGVVRFFVDGQQKTTGNTGSSGFNWPSPGAVYLGRSGAGEYFKGWITGARVTDSVARYTANFTAPTAPFPIG